MLFRSIISLHCPLNNETEKLINKDRISKMKSSVVLVNEARGAVVDEAEIANAILSKKIAAYGCDVYSQEPFDKLHPYNKIKKLSNVILTPHAAWAAYEARMRCLDTISENIEAFLDGKLKNRVDN